MGRGAGLWRLGQPTVRYAGRCRESGLRHLRRWALRVPGRTFGTNIKVLQALKRRLKRPSSSGACALTQGERFARLAPNSAAPTS